MTDSEILKALNCCLANFTRCGECPCRDGCVDSVLENALNLIKRQRTEIEILKQTAKGD